MTERCIRCNGTGEVDSGAPDPQGNFIQIPCECQTEQHEWKLVVRDDGAVGYRCSNDNFMGCRTLTKVLNEYEKLKRATEALTAEDARLLVQLAEARCEEYDSLDRYGEILNSGRSYADALAG